MNTTQIAALKQVAEAAAATYETETARLTAAGFRSQQRYTMLKDLKAKVDATHAEYSKFVKGQISRELGKIIASGASARAAAARARSPWKQAKFDAANK